MSPNKMTVAYHGIDNKRVLFISFYYPPVNNPGAIRSYKLVKYLPDYGWEPFIITAEGITDISKTLPIGLDETHVIRVPYRSWFEKAITRSRNLLSPDKKNVHNKNNSCFNLLKKLLSPIFLLPVVNALFGGRLTWYFSALKTAEHIIDKNNIDAIYSSYGPEVVHMVASTLQRKKKIPWIADFRDPWSSNPYKNNRQPFLYFEQRIEKNVLKHASSIITISEPIANQLSILHKRNIEVIPNGFDEDDFETKISPTNIFTMTHTGILYRNKRDPSILFKVLTHLKQLGYISSDSFNLRFYGSVDEIDSLLFNNSYVIDLVQNNNKISFSESIKRQQESTVLLLLSWNDPQDEGTLPSKVFEYIAARKPILAMAYRGGAIEKLLNETGCGVVANTYEEIETVLSTWIREYNEDKFIKSYFAPNDKIIGKYSRKQQAGQLAKILDGVSTTQRKRG